MGDVFERPSATAAVVLAWHRPGAAAPCSYSDPSPLTPSTYLRLSECGGRRLPLDWLSSLGAHLPPYNEAVTALSWSVSAGFL